MSSFVRKSFKDLRRADDDASRLTDGFEKSVVAAGLNQKRGDGVSAEPHKGGKVGCTVGKYGFLTTAFGVPTIEAILLDGVPLQSVVCLQDNARQSTLTTAWSLAKCFMSEGLCAGQNVLLVKGLPAENFDLPAVASTNQPSTAVNQDLSKEDERLSIAWRYRHLSIMDEDNKRPSRAAGSMRAFDIGKRLKIEEVCTQTGASFHTFDPFTASEDEFLIQLTELISRTESMNSVLRIVVSMPGPSFWPFRMTAVQFLYRLKMISTPSCVILIKVSNHLWAPEVVSDIHSLSSVVFDVVPLLDPGAKKTPLAPDVYEALLRIPKPLRSPVSLSMAAPPTTLLAVSTIKRCLHIEEFNPPPELGETSPSKKNHLEF